MTPHGAADTTELDGRLFACLPGCGFCCTTSPFVRADEEARVRASPLGEHLARRADGTLGIRLLSGARGGGGGATGAACASLGADRACGEYEHRPDACRLFPFHVHAGRRVQVSANLACPGLWSDRRDAAPATPAAVPLPEAARAVVARVLAAPDAARVIAGARDTYREFDRRLQKLGEPAGERAVARALLPAIPSLLDPDGLAGFYSGLAHGNLAPEDAAELALTEPVADAEEILAEVAEDVFPTETPTLPLRVDRAGRWLAERLTDAGAVETLELAPDGAARRVGGAASVADLLLPWSEGARREGEAYLALLTRRDHTGGVAGRLLDRMEYSVTYAASYARVVADAGAGLLLRGGLAARARGADAVAAEDARDAVAAADMAFLSLPTIGAVL